MPLGDPSVAGLYAIPTGTGLEVRDAASPGADPVGVWRSAGSIGDLAVDGTTAYLFAGTRGILAVDLATPSAPRLVGSRVDAEPALLGATLPVGGGLVVSDGAGLRLYRRSTPADIVFLSSVAYADGREIRAIRARADSLLVVSERSTPATRLVLTLYRLPAGASAPVQLREIQVPLQSPSDLAWSGDLAFAAAGSGGVVIANLANGLFQTTALPSFRAARALDVNDSLVVVGVVASGLAKLRRGHTGAVGDTLTGYTVEPLEQEPTHVTLSGSRVVVPTQDAITADEPDEIGRSVIEMRDLTGPSAIAPMGGTGRVRRVVHQGGLAYIADYTGGLRIYRAGSADTSLVGVLPVPTANRVMDLAVDPIKKRAYLAASTAGLLIVDVSDPSAPALLGSLLTPERASAVALVDTSTVIVGRRGTVSAGITLVDVSIPSAPAPLGQLGKAFIDDPRAIAVKDTVAFVADLSLGLLSVAIGTRSAPSIIGQPSGTAAVDVALSGNLLLVGTRSAGLQIVDATLPTLLNLRSTVPLPPIYGVTGQPGSALVLLGANDAAVVDIADSFRPGVRGPLAVPGFPRDASWVGDTVLVAADYGLERVLIVPAEQNAALLTIVVDPGLRPRAVISWSPVLTPGQAGLRLYRDVLSPAVSSSVVNAELLPPGTTSVADTAIVAGSTIRYRLEAVLENGQGVEAAHGTVTISSTPSVGHPYPNPFRPGGNLMVTVPFVLSNGAERPRVTIHDVRGRLVRRIDLPGSGTGGFQTVTWDGRDGSGRVVSSGVYFMAIQGQGLDDARRIVVLR